MAVPYAFRSLPLASVNVRGYLGERIERTIERNLLAVDAEAVYLRHYLSRSDDAGFAYDYAGFGQHLDAFVQLAAYTGDPRLIEKKDEWIEKLIGSQDPNGYMGVFVSQAKRDHTWDCQDRSFNVIALTNNYLLFGHRPSLEAAQRLADYSMAHPYPSLATFEEALLLLYRASREERFLNYLMDPLGLPEYRGGAQHNTTHVYGVLDRNYAQLKLYEVTGDRSLLFKSKAFLQALLSLTAMDMVGTAGCWEHWWPIHQGNGENGETCATVYNIRVLIELLKIEGVSFYGDIAERVLYNALFAAQSPDGRQLRYFTPFQDERKYFDLDYFCCPGNYRRMIAELPTLLYFQSTDGLAINLYNDSTAEFLVNGVSVTVEQVTEYPSEGRVEIHVSPARPAEFALSLRIPLWCPHATVTVNDEPATPAPSGEFFTFCRAWHPGDVVHLDLEMPWRLVRGRQSQSKGVALARGPLFYCLGTAENPDLPTDPANPITLAPSPIAPATRTDAFRTNGRQTTMPSPTGPVVLTEFIDPTGLRTFFSLPDGDPAHVVDDELYLAEWKLRH